MVNGQCVFVTPNCKFWNPTSGQCLDCNNGQPANMGLCCEPH